MSRGGDYSWREPKRKKKGTKKQLKVSVPVVDVGIVKKRKKKKYENGTEESGQGT